MFSKATLASFGTLAVLLVPVFLFPGDDDSEDKPFWERALKRVRRRPKRQPSSRRPSRSCADSSSEPRRRGARAPWN